MHKIHLKLKTPDYVNQFGVLSDVFSKEETEALINLSNTLNFESGEVEVADNQGGKRMQYVPARSRVNKEFRIVQEAWLGDTQDLDWLYNKLEDLIAQANYDLFLYDIDMIEGPVYLIYNGNPDAEEQGRYRPHRDKFSVHTHINRLITGIIMLSDKSEYTGGELYVDKHGNYDPEKVELNKGDMVLFNSYCTHHVTNVETGTRKVLVFWVTGKGSLL